MDNNINETDDEKNLDNMALKKVTLLTRETHGENSKYYYHYLEGIKIEPDSGLA